MNRVSACCLVLSTAMLTASAGSGAETLKPVPPRPNAQAVQPLPPATPPAAQPPAPPPRPAAPPKTAAPVTSSTPVALKEGQVLLNFQGADMQAVIKAVSQMTGRNFLLDPRVKGQITIISAKPVSRNAAYQIFVSALKAQGFAAVEGPSGIVKVVPSGEAKQSATVSPAKRPGGGEQMTTHVVVVQHGSATQMIPLLRPLMAPTSQLSAYEAANALIITDYADNIRRMIDIIGKLDEPASTDVTIVPLHHASALDMAELVSRLATSTVSAPATPGQAGAVQGGDRFTIIPDLRTNSLLIRTDNIGRLEQLQSLIGKLDVPAREAGNTRVVYLKNANAVKLAEVLRGLLAGEARARTASTAAPAAGRPGAPAVRATVEASLIQADEATNALIINASDAVYNSLRVVIEKLDVRRAQVYIEALIAETTSDKATEFGFQWAAATDAGSGAIGGVQNWIGIGSIVGAVIDPTTLAASGGLSLAYVGKEITLPDGTKVTGLGALARAFDDKGLGNVLSTPNLMMLDNAEAKINVGQDVPITTGSYASATGTTGVVNPFTTTQRKKIGLELKVKPQISEGGAVTMDIFQKVETLAPALSSVAGDVVTNLREIETKVVVDDGNTIVLGGLIEDRLTDSEQKVPLLGDIPILGWLFKNKSKRNQKTNLLVFLRPVVIRSAEENYAITTDRYTYLRGVHGDVEPEAANRLERFRPMRPLPDLQSDAPVDPNELLGPEDVVSATGTDS